jgi:hypothetical protein
MITKRGLNKGIKLINPEANEATNENSRSNISRISQVNSI